MHPNFLFCDNHLLIVEKPSNLATQEGLDVLAKAWVKEKFNKPGNVFLEPIHRLDKPVSGLVLFARTSKALVRLQEQMRQRLIKKTYFALVENQPSLLEAVLEHALIHDNFKARVVSEGGKKAQLHYKVIGEHQGFPLLEIDLLTGRYHQIRIQLSHSGCPIIGDAKYGSRIPYVGSGIALHHGRLEFSHPVTGLPLTFHSIPSWK